MSGAIERCIEHASDGGVDGERWSAEKQAARAELAALRAESEATKEGERGHNYDRRIWTGVFVTLDKLREWHGTIEQLLTVQNGCPLPSYEEAYRLANMEAAKSLEWLGTAIRDAEEKP